MDLTCFDAKIIEYGLMWSLHKHLEVMSLESSHIGDGKEKRCEFCFGPRFDMPPK